MYMSIRLYTLLSSRATLTFMSGSTPTPDSNVTAGVNGRRRLMDAALRLSAKKRSLHALGVRELGREAGLNANTFYRHFSDFDALGLAIMEEMSSDLRSTLREIRRSPLQPQAIARRTVEYVFDFAQSHPDAFLLGVRELHGASPTLRQALRKLIAELADEMAEDINLSKLAPGLDLTQLRRIGPMIVQQIFYMSLDALDLPQQRAELIDQATAFIDMLLIGAIARQTGPGGVVAQE